MREDPRFADTASRLEHLSELSGAVDAVMMKDTSLNWQKRLGGKVPYAPVKNIGEALENPYVADVEMVDSVAHPEKPDGLKLLASPFRINGERPDYGRSPMMGEHDEEFE